MSDPREIYLAPRCDKPLGECPNASAGLSHRVSKRAYKMAPTCVLATCGHPATDYIRKDIAEGLAEAARGMLEHYVALVNCGDCGNWDPENESIVQNARAALSAYDGSDGHD